MRFHCVVPDEAGRSLILEHFMHPGVVTATRMQLAAYAKPHSFGCLQYVPSQAEID